MIEGVINITIIVFFGVFIGVLLELFHTLSPDIMKHPIKRKSGESFWNYYRRSAYERATGARSVRATAPKSFWVVYITLFGLISMLVVVVVVSPIQMNWIAFIPSVIAAFAITNFVYYKAKAGKIKLKRRFWFDAFPEV